MVDFEKRYEGTCKWYNQDKAFGFIFVYDLEKHLYETNISYYRLGECKRGKEKTFPLKHNPNVSPEHFGIPSFYIHS